MSASDGDDDVITYSIATDDEHFAINASTGQIGLVTSINRESVKEIRLEVWATDNGKFLFTYYLSLCLIGYSYPNLCLFTRGTDLYMVRIKSLFQICISNTEHVCSLVPQYITLLEKLITMCIQIGVGPL